MINTTRKGVLITGASGLVARFTAFALAKSNEYSVFVVSSRKENSIELYKGYPNIKCYSNYELFDQTLPLSSIDYLLNFAFTRNNAPEEVTSSLDYTFKLLLLFQKSPIMNILNVSTRSIYKEPDAGELNTEDSLVAPQSAIGWKTRLQRRPRCTSS